jgi:hypothetical protein
MTRQPRRPLLLHPFLFAMHAVLAPLAANIETVGLQAIRALVIALVGVTLLLLLLRLWLHDPLKSGLLASGAVLLVGTYGHVVGLVARSLALPAWSASVLLVMWVGLGAGWAFWVLRGMHDAWPWNSYLNAAGAVLLVFPVYSIVTYTSNTPELREQAGRYRQQMLARAGVLDLVATPTSSGPPRDVYYIILDGYARADALSELYGFDNSEFLAALAQRGFYVAAESRSNYADTVYSLASSLNMAHVDDSPEALRPGIDSDQERILRNALSLLIQQSRVAEFLRAQGYEFIAFDSGYRSTSIGSADTFARSPDLPPFNAAAAFELMLMDTTVGKAYLDLRGDDFVPLQSLFDEHRGRILYTLTHLSDYSGLPGPQFVFAHVIAPHAPYVFGPHGEPRQGVDPFTLLDQPARGEWRPEYYTDQVSYINSLVLQEVDEILQSNDPDPVILLQADHSSRAWGDPEAPPAIRQQLLFPIFTAVYLPGGDERVLPYATLSPVNLFRLVFNRYFGTGLEMLPDESYVLVERGGHLVFLGACEAIGGCSGGDAEGRVSASQAPTRAR